MYVCCRSTQSELPDLTPVAERLTSSRLRMSPPDVTLTPTATTAAKHQHSPNVMMTSSLVESERAPPTSPSPSKVTKLLAYISC